MEDNKSIGAQKAKWSIGRAPWYHENASKPFVIGVTGGSASGKTSVCDDIVNHLSIPWVGLLSMDRYYKGLSKDEISVAHQGLYNFDHPDAFDMEKLYETLVELKAGRAVDVPIYDFKTHSRLEETDRMYGVDVIIVEGILLFSSEKVRDLLDLKIYVDTDNDLRLARRIKRDIAERGRSVVNVLEQYERTVKPSFEQFIQPTKRFADLIIPWNTRNQVAIDLLVQHISSRLESRQKALNPIPSLVLPDTSKPSVWSNSPYLGGSEPKSTPLFKALNTRDDESKYYNKFKLAPAGSPSIDSIRKPLILPSKLPHNLHILEPSKSLTCIHTTIRDRRTNIDDFRFAMTRLVRIICASALSHIDYKELTVTTPTGVPFHGLEAAGSVVGISIVRAGAAFEAPLREVIQDIPIGKIVIQQHTTKTTGPRLYYAKLPDLSNRTKILLFDGILATGGAVLMAIHVLIDHGADPADITFCCVAAAPEGIINVATAFPQVRIVTSAIEDGLDADYFSKPGVGFIGDRYFGTTTSTQYVLTPQLTPTGSSSSSHPTSLSLSSHNSHATTSDTSSEQEEVVDSDIQLIPL